MKYLSFLDNYPTVQRYIVSSITTFLTTFIGSLSLQLSSGVGIQLTGAFWLSLIMVALRVAGKAVVEGIFTAHADPVVPQA